MKFILKIKPYSSKNRLDSSKNKPGKGWILEFVF